MQRHATLRSRSAWLLLLAAMALGACGGAQRGAGSEGDATADHPAATTAAEQQSSGIQGASGLCSLVTQDAAAAALGEPVVKGKPKTSTVYSRAYHCRYTAADSKDILDLSVEPEKTRTEWDDDMDGAGMLDETPISGIGDAAWRSDDAALGPGTRLSAFAGGTVIWVVIYKDGDPATMYAAAESVARDLLAKVPAGLQAPKSVLDLPAGP